MIEGIFGLKMKARIWCGMKGNVYALFWRRVEIVTVGNNPI
jgi:hypothetical protein